ncbi:hypothetical protein K458DRAFT_424910 [Lentithecium fluviatile CBS 122367]|uniref:Uncharacterized protein n=1 Tax=Lentithecium fluviatile CBS 122367 TaxID=1168545 RepID=A0A6G1IDW1_9PLEO|nr:hypothetical protein K458DRAFT_424910 [Lentithecium fluviatile CBS 122367]
MLNAMKLSELLAKNIDPHLYPRIFIMSPNGTLMAYSTPVDIKELRDQAALISMAWKEQESTRKQHASQREGGSEEPSPPPPPLETLTIETQRNNIIVRALQRSLLLVLVGGVPPKRGNVFRITVEGKGDARYPAELVVEEGVAGPTSNPAESGGDAPQGEDEQLDWGAVGRVGGVKRPTPSILSTMSQREKDVKTGALHIQRKKLDALTAFIRRDFESRGFVMPDDSNFP